MQYGSVIERRTPLHRGTIFNVLIEQHNFHNISKFLTLIDTLKPIFCVAGIINNISQPFDDPSYN